MEIMKKWDEKLPIRQAILRLEAGEVVTLPISSKSLNARNNLSTLSLATGRTYRSHINRETGCVEFSRID